MKTAIQIPIQDARPGVKLFAHDLGVAPADAADLLDAIEDSLRDEPNTEYKDN